MQAPNRTLIALALAFAAAIASSAAFARTQAANGGATTTKVSTAATNPGKGNWWTEADTNGDGKLSVIEAAANAGLNARFTSIDADKDGFVTQDEYRAYFTANASQGEQHAASGSAVVSRDLWLKLDTDSDRKLSLAEATRNAGLSELFTKIDSNRDGFVTQAEYTAYAHPGR